MIKFWPALILVLAPFCAKAQSSDGFLGQHDHFDQHDQGGHEDANAWRNSPDVPVLLKKAIKEQRTGHYSGRRTLSFFKSPQHLKHDEIVYREGERTRVEFPDGSPYAGQIIVETAKERRHYMPDRNVILELPPRREENYDRLVGLARRAAEKRITISEEPGEKVAGLFTQQIVVHDQANVVVQRLFIEPRSGVVLKRQVFDSNGSQIGYFQFNQINLSPGSYDPALFRLDRPGARVVTPVDSLRDIAAHEGFEPVIFVAGTGYHLEGARVEKIKGERVLIESFGSKRGRLTLFELKKTVSPDKMQQFAHGELQVYSWQKSGKTFVLIAPRTQEDLGRLAQGVNSGTP